MSVNKVEEICKDGLTVLMNTVVCQTHKLTHENCVGCVSEKACKEFVTRFGQYVTAELQTSGYLPEDYEWNTEEDTTVHKEKIGEQ